MAFACRSAGIMVFINTTIECHSSLGHHSQKLISMSHSHSLQDVLAADLSHFLLPDPAVATSTPATCSPGATTSTPGGACGAPGASGFAPCGPGGPRPGTPWGGASTNFRPIDDHSSGRRGRINRASKIQEGRKRFGVKNYQVRTISNMFKIIYNIHFQLSGGPGHSRFRSEDKNSLYWTII